MTRFARMLGATLTISTMIAGAPTLAGPAFAQGQPRPLPPTAPRMDRLAKAGGVIEGKLTRVDGRTERVDVSIGPFGLLGKTLEVGPETLIEVNGREARFADLHEGAKVKAFYEERGAKLVATRLVVTGAPG
jgi:hypothetical protein